MLFLEWSKFLNSVSSPDEKIPALTKVSHLPCPHWEGRFLPYPSNDIWKTWACFSFSSRDVEIISTYFSVWLWTVTQFNTPKSEMSLKLLLVMGNEFLISTWKYRIESQEMKVFSGLQLEMVLITLLSKSVCGRVREWLKYLVTFQQFWKLTNNGPKWCNFKMHVIGCYR